MNVYDTNFHPVRMDEDAFRDEDVPEGFAPFNVQNIGGNLYVAFAQQDSQKHDEVDGPGLGYVDVFSPSGRSVASAAAWSMAQCALGNHAGSDRFGAYSHDILVGQFGSGKILTCSIR